ncbi:hypothetical protein D3C87_1551890 [compost metagenome]
MATAHHPVRSGARHPGAGRKPRRQPDLRHGSVRRGVDKAPRRTVAEPVARGGQGSAAARCRTAVAASAALRCADPALEPGVRGATAVAHLAPVVRGPGCATAERHRAGLRRRTPDLRCAQRPGQPPGAQTARAGCRSRGAGRHRHRAGDAAGGRLAGDSQGRRRLRAPGPAIPGRAPELHDRRQRHQPAADSTPSDRRVAGP